jgi:hypothetical protein
MTEKRIVYADVPSFDQQTQYVTQGEPVETDDMIYYPCVIHNLPEQEDNSEMII